MASPPRVALLPYPRWLRSPLKGRGGPWVPPAESWAARVGAFFTSPEDRALIDDLIARGVSLTLYDSIVFRDPYYDGKQWVVREFPAGGSSTATAIHLRRTGHADVDAATLVHEIVHTRQPADMPSREKEFHAHVEEERWRMAHGLDRGYPTFRDVGADGREFVDEEAIRAYVAIEYPGVSTPGQDGALEEVIGRTKSGRTKVVDDHGTVRRRAPQEGDSYGGKPMLDPPDGEPVDLARLR